MIRQPDDAQSRIFSSSVPGFSLGAGGVDLARWLAERGLGKTAASSPPTRRTDRSTPLEQRASAYLMKLPPSISGQGGHGRAFHAACVLVKGFGLSIDQARPLLEDWNRSCEPPWSAAELEHKLRDADRVPDDSPRGYLAARDREPRRPEPRARQRPESAPVVVPANDESDVEERGLETNPHRLAVLFLNQNFSHPGGVGLRFWRDQFHRWDGSAYREASNTELRAQISQCLVAEFRRIRERDRAAVEADPRGKNRRPPTAIPVTGRLVSDVLQALAGLVLLRFDEHDAQPSWIDAIPATLAADPSWRPTTTVADHDEPSATPADRECDLSAWPASELISARNGLIHPPSFLTGARCMTAPTPRFFHARALNYDFDPKAPSPRVWLDLLSQIWPNDPTSIDCLQEWFGYLLTSDTRYQKILMMIGPKRSGRGTIGRVLKALAGPSNVVNPTLATLARPFGLSVLLDKPIAIFPDARLSSRPDNAAIVEALLSISGEDDQSIDRKHLPAWTGRLPTRFVLISNELPRLRDSSGALSSRLIILRFTQSFYDREDVALFQKLERELPGILLWALEGLRRLRLRGRFLQPDSAHDLIGAMDEMASPIATFLKDCCILDPDASVASSAIYDAWRAWCREHGREAVGEEHALGRDLHAVLPGLTKSRRRIGVSRQVYYNGLRLRTAGDIDLP